MQHALIVYPLCGGCGWTLVRLSSALVLPMSCILSPGTAVYKHWALHVREILGAMDDAADAFCRGNAGEVGKPLRRSGHIE